VGDFREHRMAQNEALARRINDEVEYRRPGNGDLPHSFVCECVHEECTELVNLEVGAYVHVRSHPRRFVVLPGHEEPDIESIVEVYASYIVVQKRGEAGRLAEAEAAG
jgi:hypothetical protein